MTESPFEYARCSTCGQWLRRRWNRPTDAWESVVTATRCPAADPDNNPALIHHAEPVPDHPDYHTPVAAPPHFTCNCSVCAKLLDTSRELVYPGSEPWTYRCADHQVSDAHP